MEAGMEGRLGLGFRGGGGTKLCKGPIRFPQREKAKASSETGLGIRHMRVHE